MADRDNETDDRDDDEAWLAQLRTALASAGDAGPDGTDAPDRFTKTWPAPLVVRTAPADRQPALQELTQRVAALESLVRDLGDRLEAQQRRLVDDLAADRQRLIEEAVAEIRTMLFGQ